MTASFQRLRAGQPWRVNEPTARAIIESAEYWARHSRDPDQVPPPEYRFEGSVIQCRNDTGCDLMRFDAVGFADALIHPADNLQEFQNYPRFSLRTPTAADAGAFGICVEPIESGAVGMVLVAGVIAAQIKRTAGDAHPAFADVDAGRTDLLPATGGAQVLYCDPAPGSGSSDVWAYVRLPDGIGGSIGSTGTTTTTTTTTTPNPANNPCGGTGRMTWSASTNQWSVSSSSCGTTTTTSSTTTTSGGTTTTTTAGPTTTTTTRRCPTTTSTTTTTTASGTTTTPAPCQCQYPKWCGTFDGECTVVHCANVTSSAGGLSCGPTTSTTTSTPCPTTTTTTPAPCCQGCCWYWDPTFGYIFQSGGCCGTPECGQCPTPDAPADPTSCQVVQSGCSSAATTAPPVCAGTCNWAWVCQPIANCTGVDCGGGFWTYVGGNCTGDFTSDCGFNCNCPAPSDAGSCGAVIATACGCSSPTTTTGNPCAPATTSTSTTPLPCNQQCYWQWSTGSGAWNAINDPCPAWCDCCPPYYAGTQDCETAYTSCGTGVCPTTTSTSTTTTSGGSSTTTTTTSCACPGCNCVWQCTGGRWTLPSDTYTCLVSCVHCCDPNGSFGSCCDVALEGQTVATNCQQTPCTSTPPPTCSGTIRWVCHNLGNRSGAGTWSQTSACSGDCGGCPNQQCASDVPNNNSCTQGGQVTFSTCFCKTT